jgi:hypothetical protein
MINQVIRVCLTCNAIYLDKNEGLEYIQLCKFCSRSTGFFEHIERFFRYIDLYGIDTDWIKDNTLKNKVYAHYNIVEK